MSIPLPPLPAGPPAGTKLFELPAETQRAFAGICAAHALVALAADPRAAVLQAALAAPALTGPDRYARWQAILDHPWGGGTDGPARRVAWLAVYWALWPADPFSAYAADQATHHARWAVAEQATAATPPGNFFAVERAEAAWQRAQLAALLVADRDTP